MILVTHKGATSGIERTSPLVHARDGDRVGIIASMGGASTHSAALTPNFEEYQGRTDRVIPVVVLTKAWCRAA